MSPAEFENLNTMMDAMMTSLSPSLDAMYAQLRNAKIEELDSFQFDFHKFESGSLHAIACSLAAIAIILRKLARIPAPQIEDEPIQKMDLGRLIKQ